MMRNLYTVAVAATLLLSAGSASAISVNIIWNDTGTADLEFGLGEALPATATASVFLDTEDTPNLSAYSFSVILDTANGLLGTAATEEGGFEQSGWDEFESLSPGVVVSAGGDSMSSWDGVAATFGTPDGAGPCPNNTGAITDGVCDGAFGYFLGTLTVDLSGIDSNTPSTSLVTPGVFASGVDDFFAVNPSGGEDNINAEVVFNSASVNVVPEPGTALLLGLGLSGLAVAARRRI